MYLTSLEYVKIYNIVAWADGDLWLILDILKTSSDPKGIVFKYMDLKRSLKISKFKPYNLNFVMSFRILI